MHKTTQHVAGRKTNPFPDRCYEVYVRATQISAVVLIMVATAMKIHMLAVMRGLWMSTGRDFRYALT